MIRNKISFFIVSLFMVTSICPGVLVADDKEDEIVATIGPYSLTETLLEKQIQSVSSSRERMMYTKQNIRDEIINDWVEMTLMAVEASALGIDKNETIAMKIENYRNAILAQELARQYLQDKISVSDEEIEKYYSENISEFEVMEMVRASHILLRVEDNKDEVALQSVATRAEEIKNLLDNGADFSKLAEELSEDPTSRQKGGDLGYFGKDMMSPEFEKMVFALEKNQISTPVKTKFGIHIIKLTDKVDARTIPLSEAKGKISQMLQMKQQEKFRQELITDLKKKHTVTINTTPVATIEATSQKKKKDN